MVKRELKKKKQKEQKYKNTCLMNTSMCKKLKTVQVNA